MFILNSIEPMKVVKIQKLANQPMFSGTLGILTIIFMKARKTLIKGRKF